MTPERLRWIKNCDVRARERLKPWMEETARVEGRHAIRHRHELLEYIAELERSCHCPDHMRDHS